MIKVISYNVNGIRAAITKDLAGWLAIENPDILCLQEVKAEILQVDLKPFEEMGYNIYWNAAQKKGYSGVAIFSKHKPQYIEIGCGIPEIDHEGRIIRLDFEKFSVISAYFPSGSGGDNRQNYKMKFLEKIENYFKNLLVQLPNLIVSGDYNICHKAIDIHNPKSNANTSGFLPEEREWMENFTQKYFVDSFREVNKEPHQYSWWSYRAGARGKNLGWRIDYNMVSKPLQNSIKSAKIHANAIHSDHCPIEVILDI